MPSTRTRLRGQLANAERRCRANPDDPTISAAVVELRTEYRTEALAEHIKRVVDSAPALTASQRDRLAVLLRGGT
jgi:hypothetical protein